MSRWKPLLFLLFVSVISTANAVSADAGAIRIGQDVAISGRIADMQQSTVSFGYTFRVNLSGIHYKGRVDRTLLQKKESGRLTIWLALRDVVLTIDRTSLSGRPGSAVCGPIKIRMGHRRDLWVAFDFEMTTIDDQSTLKLTNTRFALPADNWSVGDPAWVKTSGFGMSRSKVTNGLRRGLTDNRQRIEEKLIEAGPKMLAAAVAAVPENTPVNRQSIERAVQNKLILTGYLSQKQTMATTAVTTEMD